MKKKGRKKKEDIVYYLGIVKNYEKVMIDDFLNVLQRKILISGMFFRQDSTIGILLQILVNILLFR